ncbi:MAG: NAD(P)-dependent oxidoreductase [Gemmatimonadetes bacterium]|nr:NAD(P)-dependent oxidoreductase [Gemmatimonadota bacterium]
MSAKYNVLLIGGRGNIGSGLRTYLPRLNELYHITSVDLPGANDKATDADAQNSFIDLDINASPNAFRDLLPDCDLVVYLARRGELQAMNEMSDLVYESVLAQDTPPMVIGSSSVHAVDGLYSFYNEKETFYHALAERNFDAISEWPERISATVPAHAINDYGREKAHVEEWTKRIAKQGHSAVSIRWGGINAQNAVMVPERGYFSVWCHQEDAARLVHRCFEAHLNNTLPSGAHYFAISDNTYNIFDIETPRTEVGYDPVHNAETYYE